MSTYNRVVIVGRLTRDPEVRQIGKGTPVCSMGIAVADYSRDAAGARVERPCFIDVDAWNEQATNCGKYLRKGQPVLIEGRLQMDSWETKEGERRTKLKVRAHLVIFLGGSQGGEARGQANGAGGRAAGRPVGRAGGKSGDADAPRREQPEDANMPF